MSLNNYLSYTITPVYPVVYRVQAFLFLATRFATLLLFSFSIYWLFAVASFEEYIPFLREYFQIAADQNGIEIAISLFTRVNYVLVMIRILVLLLVISIILQLLMSALKFNSRIRDLIVLLGLYAVAVIYGSSRTTHINFFLLPVPVILIAIGFAMNAYAHNDGKTGFLNTSTGKFVSYLFISIPLLCEIFFPVMLICAMEGSLHNTFSGPISRRLHILASKASLMLGGSIIMAVFIPLIFGSGVYGKPVNNDVRSLAHGCFYSLDVDSATNRLLACKQDSSELMIFDIKNPTAKPLVKFIEYTELQDIRINEKKREIYHYSRADERLRVYDLDTFDLKRVSPRLEGNGSGRVEYNEKSGTIIVTSEDDYIWLLDDETLDPVYSKSFAEADNRWRNEYVDSDPDDDRYYLTHYRDYENTYVLHGGSRKIESFHTGLYQGASEISRRRNELYIALPLKSEILVFDRTTLKQKKSIRTVFGVRNINYDETNDILISGSMCTGYLDIIDLKKPENRKRLFVDYYIREIEVNSSTRDAFVSSFFGLYHIQY